MNTLTTLTTEQNLLILNKVSKAAQLLAEVLEQCPQLDIDALIGEHSLLKSLIEKHSK